MHSRELPCFNVCFFQVSLFLANYLCWVSNNWNRESFNCCHLVLAKELDLQINWLLYLKVTFATILFVIIVKWPQDSKVFVVFIYVICPTLSKVVPLVLFTLPLLTIWSSHFAWPNVMLISDLNTQVSCINEARFCSFFAYSWMSSM